MRVCVFHTNEYQPMNRSLEIEGNQICYKICLYNEKVGGDIF